MSELDGVEATRELRRVVPVGGGAGPDHVRRRLGVRGFSGCPPAPVGVLQGAEQQEIANHLSAIFAKLQVADRTQAVLRARDAGLGRRTS